MALKIAKKKCAEGYQLSDERCETCDMPLLSMNGQLACKVCPALAKLVTMKTGVGVQEEKVYDARDTTEVIEICSEPRDNKVSADEDDVSSVHAESAASLQMKVNA